MGRTIRLRPWQRDALERFWTTAGGFAVIDEVHHAGGLVIAMDVDHARAIADLLERRWRVRPTVATSDDPMASARIARFSSSSEEQLSLFQAMSAVATGVAGGADHDDADPDDADPDDADPDDADPDDADLVGSPTTATSRSTSSCRRCRAGGARCWSPRAVAGRTWPSRRPNSARTTLRSSLTSCRSPGNPQGSEAE